VLAFLAKTEAVVRAIGDSPSLHPAGEDGDQTAELLWTLLEQTPELDSIDVASDDGHLLMALRYPSPAVRQVLRDPAFSTETWQYKRSPDAEGGDAKQRFATTHRAAFRSDYDPTQRTWFVEAAEGRARYGPRPFSRPPRRNSASAMRCPPAGSTTKAARSTWWWPPTCRSGTCRSWCASSASWAMATAPC
jgi:adenylate cyclase